MKIYFRRVQVVCTSRSLTFARFLLQRRSALAKSGGIGNLWRARTREIKLFIPATLARRLVSSLGSSIYSIIIDYALLTGTRFDVFKADNFVKLEPSRSRRLSPLPSPLALIFKESRKRSSFEFFFNLAVGRFLNRGSGILILRFISYALFIIYEWKLN